MRKFTPLVAALALAGCTDNDWANLMSFNADSPPPAQAVARANYDAYVRSVPRTAERMCATTATDRAGDIAVQGFDSDEQKHVYDTTYADCMAWSAKRQPR